MKIRLILLSLIFLFGVSQAREKRALTFEDMLGMKRVSSARVSPDGRWIAYQVKTYDIGANKGDGNLHLVSIDGKTHRQLTFHPGSEGHPRWSPDGKSLAFLSSRDGSSQVYLLPLAGGEARKLTDLPTGVNGFTWSPDGEFLAEITDMYPEAETPAASAQIEEENASRHGSGRVIDNLLFRHWNSWREGKYSKVVVVPVDGGEAQLLTPGAYDTPPISLGSSHDVVWSPNSQQICLVQNRDKIVAASTNNDLWLTGRDGGELSQITQNRGNDYAPRFAPDGKSIAYLSMARAGFEADQSNLMITDPAGKSPRNLTETLDLSIRDFVWAPNSKKIYAYAPYHGRHRLYEINAASGKRKLLLDNHYISSLEITPDGKALILSLQRINMPTEIFRFDIRKKQLSQLTFTNKERLEQLEMNPIEDYWFSGANGDSVHLLMVKPPHFDPTKKYPLLSLIHGGPQGAWGDQFHYRWNAEMFAAPGYVTIMINFHGSRGYGQKFCDAVSKDWGGAPYQDIILGTKWALEHFDFVDRERVGAAGASYGGFMINWIEGHNPDKLFKVLVSHDGVFEQVSMFGATEELWFPMWEFNGTPWEVGSVYHQWNPIHYVNNFETPMLVIHGEHDYRVPYTQGLQLFTALQMKGVPSRLLFYPDDDHFVQKPQNAELWWKTVQGWLAEYLKP